MKKRNNRGFTLIEMLAVIAVLAILVSVIVPIVTNASDKAAAAADAANLRSAKAAIAQGLLDETYSEGDTITAEELDIPAVGNYNKKAFSVTIEEGVITVSYGDLDIAELGDLADNGKADNSNAASQTVPTEAASG